VAILTGILSTKKEIYAIREFEVEREKLIIPSMIRDEKGRIEDAFGSKVVVGP
jgi:CO dehydrogenase/acetyl-CoA synthase gamma subunit (corrinoid Fe-S protein)